MRNCSSFLIVAALLCACGGDQQPTADTTEPVTTAVETDTAPAEAEPTATEADIGRIGRQTASGDSATSPGSETSEVESDEETGLVQKDEES